jgi:XisH protein
MARDKYHQAVRIALEKLGWVITHDPLKLEVDDIYVLVDLGAERLIAAERDNEKIAIEIKTFSGSSDINDFHTALGQFLNYQAILLETEPERVVFIAVPEDTWYGFFQTRFIQKICQQHKLHFVVYHPLKEVIVLWNLEKL